MGSAAGRVIGHHQTLGRLTEIHHYAPSGLGTICHCAKTGQNHWHSPCSLSTDALCMFR